MNVKNELRASMLSERNSLKADLKQAWDKEICAQLIDLIVQEAPKVIHSFIPMGMEIDIKPVIDFALGKNIVVVCPKAMKGRKMDNLVLRSLSELESGVYGTKHPAGNNIYTGVIDFIITPGLAFDKKGNRIGYGAGYYDAFLKENTEALSIGIGYDFQIVENIPTEEHDVAVKQVLTNG